MTSCLWRSNSKEISIQKKKMKLNQLCFFCSSELEEKYFTPRKIASAFFCAAFFYPLLQRAHFLFRQTQTQIGLKICTNTHSGTSAKQQSAIKSVVFGKSIIMLFLFKNFVQFGTAHNSVHCIFTHQVFFLTRFMSACALAWYMFLCLCWSCHLSKAHLNTISLLTGRYVLKAGPLCCSLERCLRTVFQHTHPFANNLRQSPHTSSLESSNRLGCLHCNTSRRMAH